VIAEGGLLTASAFKGGVHPPDHKETTRAIAVTRAPVPERVFVPMSQHLGAVCTPLVARGDRVARGQLIGDVDALVSAPVHAPYAGEIASVGPRRLASGQLVQAVEIVCDPEQDFDSFVPVPDSDDLRDMVRAAGIVGMGGAAFPARVKLAPPKDMPIGTVILNGCECEPYLTCDHRLMLERSQRIVAGVRLIREMVGAERVVIGIEENKADAADAIRQHTGTDVEVLVVPTRYPQGAEKQLILAVLGKEVPHGKLPASTGALVHNVGTAAAIADAIELRKPLIERVVTVTGQVKRPSNLLVAPGTSFVDAIAACGGFVGDVGRVISGGPMTGMGVASLDVPVVKGTSGIVALPTDVVAPAVLGDQPCIRCGRCSAACPMMLQPFAIGIYANRKEWEQAGTFHALDCIECGCCSYVCPTNRPLVQLIRLAKHALLERGAKL
jgi:electron transport complex protein RnfC